MRRTWKPKALECFRLSVNDLNKYNLLTPGASFEWIHTVDEVPRDRLSAKTGNDHLHISYEYQGDRRAYDIQILTTPCNYGGHRKWFECPACFMRVGVLMCMYGWFKCRHCHGISYASESYTDLERLRQRRNRLEAKYKAAKGGKYEQGRWRDYVEADIVLNRAIETSLHRRYGNAFTKAA